MTTTRRVAVGRGARAGGEADIADRAGAVLDNDALPQFRRQLGGQQPAEQIIGPAGRKRDNDGDGALGPSGARRLGPERGKKKAARP